MNDRLYNDPRVEAFLNNNSFEKRKKISNDICLKITDRLPLILCRANKSNLLFSKYKFLAMRSSIFLTFIQQIKSINIEILDPNTSLYFFTLNGVLIKNNLTIEDIYYRYRSDDGFLYLIYALQETFGAGTPRFRRKKLLNVNDLLNKQLINKLTQYPQKELIYLSNKDKIILAYQIKDWRHALSWGYEKLCDVFLEKNDETSILQAFELAISLKYYHNVKYLNDRFGSFYQTEIISTLLQCKQYNWHTLNYYLSISNFSEIVQKRILISAAIVNDNVDYLENCAFTDFEYRKIIKYNSFRVYSKYCCYKSLLKDWSYAVKYSAYEIIFIIKNLLFHQPFVISCQEELLQALHKTKFNCYALAYFFLAENNSQIVKNYRLSDNLEIRQQEIRILNYLSNIPKAFETDEMKY